MKSFLVGILLVLGGCASAPKADEGKCPHGLTPPHWMAIRAVSQDGELLCSSDLAHCCLR